MNENSCNFGPTIIDNDLKNKNQNSFSMKYTPNKLQDSKKFKNVSLFEFKMYLYSFFFSKELGLTTETDFSEKIFQK